MFTASSFLSIFNDKMSPSESMSRRIIIIIIIIIIIKKLNSVALVRERTIPTERPPPVGEVSANFCG